MARQPTPEPGEQLPRRFGKYTLLRKVATGGMAELYLALHRSVAGFEKLVAVKRVLPHLAEDQAFVEMLLQEARVAAQLDHPNIAHIFDVGVHEGEYYIAMEFVHGEDLRSIVRQMKKKGVTSFPLEHTLAIVLGCCAGLAYAHEKKDLDGEPLHIVHRDVSPQNILVTFSGDVKLVDFGIAKVGAQIEDTGSGKLKGKIPYMSPEQARGEPLDQRSDIFSLGVILFELSTGRRLFRGRNQMETLRLITDSEYPRPRDLNPNLPEPLERIILKALAKDREQRYQSARQMQADLEAFVREHQLPVSPISLGQWMQSLFEEKLAQQKKLLQEGRQLADVIAAQVAEERTGTGATTGSHVRTKGAVAARWPWMAALGALALLGGAAWLWRRQAPPPVATGPGVLRIESRPPGAAIWIDGERRPERTPARIAHLPVETTYRVKLTKDGYQPHTVQVRPTRQHPEVSIRAELQPRSAAALGVLEITSDPPGAHVVLDGKDTGKVTPATLDGLEPDVEHTVALVLNGFEPRTVRVRLKAGKVEKLRQRLERTPLGQDEALLLLQVEPPEAKATLDGEPLRRLGGGPLEIRTRAGRHELLVRHPGRKTLRKRLQLPGGRPTELRIELERERRKPTSSAAAVAPPTAGPGRLTFDARPWCNVTVAGRHLGQTPIVNATLPAGRHRLVCVNPELGVRKVITVQIRPGETTRQRIRLR